MVFIMMNKIKKTLFLLFLSTQLFALDIYDDIANSIRSGDARQLAVFFGNTIDLQIIDQENVYSKAQAELILKDFFIKNQPKSFTILHKGSSPEGTQYVIGNLTTTKGKSFRTSFHLKTINGRSVLQELRIENK